MDDGGGLRAGESGWGPGCCQVSEELHWGSAGESVETMIQSETFYSSHLTNLSQLTPSLVIEGLTCVRERKFRKYFVFIFIFSV